MAKLKVEVQLEVDDHLPMSRYHIQALLRRLTLISFFKTSKILFIGARDGKASIYGMCESCGKTLRKKIDGRLVRHGCDDEDV